MKTGELRMKNMVVDPYIIIFEMDGQTRTEIHPREGMGFEAYAIMTADLIKHIANCFRVDGSQVVEWINKELRSPTTKIEGGKLQ